MEIQQFIERFSNQFEEFDVKNINETVDFKQLATWDSLTSMSIQVMIEDEYNVKITSDDLKRIQTVFDLFQLVKIKIKNA